MVTALLRKVRKCTLCEDLLPNAPKPILNFSSHSKILLVGQAPGIRAPTSGTPWDDASGERLRDWLGVSPAQFYDPEVFAIVPMGFCYPGKGKSGDLPPRPECAEKWMALILSQLKNVKLRILIGSYACSYFLKEDAEKLTPLIKSTKSHGHGVFPLPHPSPRNNIWLKKNPWFEKTVLPKLKKKVLSALKPALHD